jgi:phage terminase small subunit
MKKEKQKQLNQQQELFAFHYAKTKNGTRSAILAGYSEKTARQYAVQLLANEKVVAKIAECKDLVAKNLCYNLDAIQMEFAQIFHTSKNENVKMKALAHLTENIWKQRAFNSIDKLLDEDAEKLLENLTLKIGR